MEGGRTVEYRPRGKAPARAGAPKPSACSLRDQHAASDRDWRGERYSSSPPEIIAQSEEPVAEVEQHLLCRPRSAGIKTLLGPVTEFENDQRRIGAGEQRSAPFE